MATAKLDKRLTAFLDLIAWSEGTSTSSLTKNDGYDVIVSGIDGPHTFTDYSTHPFAHGRPPIVVADRPRGILSTASGRYQIILDTWRNLVPVVGAKTFGRVTQDLMAAELINDRLALQPILAGNIEDAITLCSPTWASLPGALYSQPEHAMSELLATYTRLLAGQSI